MLFVIPAKAGIQYEIVSAAGGSRYFFTLFEKYF